MHLSGQVAVDAYERTVGDDFAIQLPVVFDNIERVLDATGGALIHVVALRIYLVESVRDQQQEGADAMRSRFPSTRRRGVVAA